MNGWAMDERLRMNRQVMETNIPKMFRFTVFHSPGLQPWDSGFPGIKKYPKTLTPRAFTPFLQKTPKKIFVFHPSLLFTFTS
jgi:hypothetical protein